MAEDPTPAADPTASGDPQAAEPTPAPSAPEVSVDELLKEIKELRNENANRRVKSKQYEAAFADVPDEQQEAWLELISTWTADPKAGATSMKEVVDQILADQAAEGVTQTDGLSRAEVEKMIKAQAQELQLSQDVARIEAEAQTLGYNPNSEEGSDADLDYKDLINVALTLPKTATLADAHKVLEARRQKIIDEYIKSKGADASRTPTAPAAGGSAVSQEQNLEVKTLQDVEKRAIARFTNQKV